MKDNRVKNSEDKIKNDKLSQRENKFYFDEAHHLFNTTRIDILEYRN